MKKRTLEVVIIFAISILITVLLAFCYIHYFNKKTIPTPTVPVDNKTVYSFKIFTYEVPNNLKFTDYNDSQFKIEGTGWYALVKLYYDENISIYSNSEVFSNIINLIEKDIESSEKFILNNREIISFNKSSDKSILCYFSGGLVYDYEVRIYNDDNTYNNECLKEIVPILTSYELDLTNINNYQFDVIDLKKSDN